MPRVRLTLVPLDDRSVPTILPAGFAETLLADGLNRPTAVAVAPDGRAFVAEQTGGLRVVENGALLADPFVALTVDSAGERGLVGVALDPNFASNGFVYVYYTVPAAGGSAPFNRVSRFTAAGNAAAPGSERVLLDLDPLTAATNHNGGPLAFGPDGKLYVAVGDNNTGANAQSLANRLGKVLRVNPDGSIPADNPTAFDGLTGTTAGANRAIFTVGLRNPFALAFSPATGQLLINDVGQTSFEEINAGRAGANYAGRPPRGRSTLPRSRHSPPRSSPTRGTGRSHLPGGRSPAGRSMPAGGIFSPTSWPGGSTRSTRPPGRCRTSPPS